MTEPRPSLSNDASADGVTLRLLWPQWQVRRIVTDIDAVTDVVGLMVAEFIPRQVMQLQQLLTAFPLLRASRAGSPSGIARLGSDPT